MAATIGRQAGENKALKRRMAGWIIPPGHPAVAAAAETDQ
jgi:hypothetical protein